MLILDAYETVLELQRNKVVLCNWKNANRTKHSGTQVVEGLNKTKQLNTHV